MLSSVNIDDDDNGVNENKKENDDKDDCHHFGGAIGGWFIDENCKIAKISKPF